MSARSPFDLTGRTAVVTGANTGIGQGAALALAQAGAKVIGVGRSPLDETAAMIAETGGTFVPVKADLAQTDGLRPLCDRIWDETGAIDILVNNAGIIRRADALDFTEADWNAVIDTNLKSLFFLTQAFARRVIAAGRRAKVVNIASLLSFQGGIRVASYTTSKSGLAGLTRLLANEWAARGINVNAIAPGYIETNNTAALRADPERSGEILKRIPAGRWGKPEDIGGAVVFLASSASDYMHGAIVPVDGGWLAR